MKAMVSVEFVCIQHENFPVDLHQLNICFISEDYIGNSVYFSFFSCEIHGANGCSGITCNEGFI